MNLDLIFNQVAIYACFLLGDQHRHMFIEPLRRRQNLIVVHACIFLRKCKSLPSIVCIIIYKFIIVLCIQHPH
jgi:hypothetical protein